MGIAPLCIGEESKLMAVFNIETASTEAPPIRDRHRENGSPNGSKALVSVDGFRPEEEKLQNIFDLFTPPHSFEQASAILDYHKRVAEAHGVNGSVYFNFTSETLQDPDGPSVHVPYHGLEVRGGKMAAFSAAEMAVIIHEQMRAYVYEKAMGECFPIDNPSAVEELVASMIGGYDADTLYVVAEHAKDEKYTPVAMVRVTIGQDETPLGEHIGDPNSNLPTLAALTIPPELVPQELAETPCNQIICVGRLALSEQAFSEVVPLEDQELYKSIAVYVLSQMSRVVELASAEREQPLTQVVFDTNHRGVRAIGKRNYGSDEVAGPKDFLPNGHHAVQPTEAIGKSILNLHYGTPESWDSGPAGYRGQIWWMTTTVEKYIEGGKKDI